MLAAEILCCCALRFICTHASINLSCLPHPNRTQQADGHVSGQTAELLQKIFEQLDSAEHEQMLNVAHLTAHLPALL